MRLRAHFAGLLAALALTATASAQQPQEITLMPAQPVAPTRTEQMSMTGYGVDGQPLTGLECPADGATAEASRRRIVDGTYRRTLWGMVERFNSGVAMPLRCSCWAAEYNFFLGSCRSFYNPKWECNACGILGCGARFAPVHYGPGSRGTAPACSTPRTDLPISR